MVFFSLFKKKNLEGGRGWGEDFFFPSLFVTLLLFGSFFCYFLFILEGEGVP